MMMEWTWWCLVCGVTGTFEEGKEPSREVWPGIVTAATDHHAASPECEGTGASIRIAPSESLENSRKLRGYAGAA